MRQRITGVILLSLLIQILADSQPSDYGVLIANTHNKTCVSAFKWAEGKILELSGERLTQLDLGQDPCLHFSLGELPPNNETMRQALDSLLNLVNKSQVIPQKHLYSSILLYRSTQPIKGKEIIISILSTTGYKFEPSFVRTLQFQEQIKDEWVLVNYNIGALDQNGNPSRAALELGERSAYYAYETKISDPNLNFSINNTNITLQAEKLIGCGYLEARNRSKMLSKGIKNNIDLNNNTTNNSTNNYINITNPCWPRGFRYDNVTGAWDYASCYNYTKDETIRIVNNKTSLITGTMNYIAFNKFYDIFSLFVPNFPGYYKDNNLFHLTPPLVALENKIIERCNDTWDDSNHTLSRWDCFDALYTHVMIREVMGIGKEANITFANSTEDGIPIDWPPGNLIQEASVQRLLHCSDYRGMGCFECCRNPNCGYCYRNNTCLVKEESPDGCFGEMLLTDQTKCYPIQGTPNIIVTALAGGSVLTLLLTGTVIYVIRKYFSHEVYQWTKHHDDT